MKKTKLTAPAPHSLETSERDQLGLEQLVFFSDAVFAIAITVLVLDIRLPEGVASFDNAQLLSMLTGLSHKYFAYALSFWVIGLYWISHHRKFLLIKRFDNRLLMLNLLLLSVIAFIPFPTSVISESGNRTATIFYALVMTLAGLLLEILWWHAAHNHKLIDPHADKQSLRWEAVGPLAAAAIFLLSIGVTFFDEGLVRLFWLLILPVPLLFRKRG